MAESEVQNCPVCGKTVLPLSTLAQHVEECLAISEIKRETRAKTSKQTKGDTKKSSFFSSKKVDSKTTQKSPTNSQKRVVSFLAGKSDTSPPGKKAKLEDGKNIASSFFQPKKDNAKPIETITIKTDTKTPNTSSVKIVSKEIPSNQGGSSQNPVKLVSMRDASNKEKSSGKNEFIPLAERMRPCGLQDYVGQSKVVGGNSLLRSLLEANEVPSMILWGPPGCGKVGSSLLFAPIQHIIL